MKIRSVEPIPIKYNDPNGPHPDPRTRTEAFIHLVKITTDEGLVGWGETWTRFSEANRAVYEVINGVADQLIGEDPLATSALFDRLAKRMYWYGEGGIAWLALSAIDIALWDIRCRAANMSLVDMLGGARAASVPVVVSSHPHRTEVDGMVEEAVETVRGRAIGYKFGMMPGSPSRLGADHDRDVAYIGGLRKALGSDALIVADARATVGWDVATAVRRARAFEEHRLTWLEEPLQPWDRSGYALFKSRTNMLVGYGEREWTIANYERVIEDGLSDVIGVDPGRCGGVTATLRIVERIQSSSRYFNSHSWSGAILSAVGLAISAASGKALLFEIKPIPDPMQTELVETPVLPNGVAISPPRTPGIGVDIREDVVRRFRSDR